MDARELTEKYHKMKAEIADLEKRIAELELLVERMRLAVNDGMVDIAMLSGKRQDQVIQIRRAGE